MAAFWLGSMKWGGSFPLNSFRFSFSGKHHLVTVQTWDIDEDDRRTYIYKECGACSGVGACVFDMRRIGWLSLAGRWYAQPNPTWNTDASNCGLKTEAFLVAISREKMMFAIRSLGRIQTPPPDYLWCSPFCSVLSVAANVISRHVLVNRLN